VTGYQRNRIFIFQSYVDIFRGENETKWFILCFYCLET
jgi:hypothetical protein